MVKRKVDRGKDSLFLGIMFIALYLVYIFCFNDALMPMFLHVNVGQGCFTQGNFFLWR